MSADMPLARETPRITEMYILMGVEGSSKRITEMAKKVAGATSGM